MRAIRRRQSRTPALRALPDRIRAICAWYSPRRQSSGTNRITDDGYSTTRRQNGSLRLPFRYRLSVELGNASVPCAGGNVRPSNRKALLPQAIRRSANPRQRQLSLAADKPSNKLWAQCDTCGHYSGHTEPDVPAHTVSRLRASRRVHLVTAETQRGKKPMLSRALSGPDFWRPPCHSSQNEAGLIADDVKTLCALTHTG